MGGLQVNERDWKPLMFGNPLALKTSVTDTITVETVSFEDSFVTYCRIQGRRIGTLQYYEDELDAREGHLRWVRLDWQRRTLAEIGELAKAQI